jgi:2-polyprenyl-3-methyl-5-hydroxy-6-metoxy-1,4-benzoquinol methylase
MNANETGAAQAKHAEWYAQWALFQDDEKFLFEEWIAPATLEDFRGKSVLECGCGGGQHTAFLAPVAASITAVDLNTVELARTRNAQFANVRFLEADIARMDLGEQFDVVLCVGVIHHTDHPDQTFANLYRHCKPGGRVIVWTYSAEGNALVRWVVEPFRRAFVSRWPRAWVVGLSRGLTLLLYPVVYTVYRLPGLNLLPYYEYFRNFRRLSFERNVLNVFDKLNAPQTRFTTRAQCSAWFNPAQFEPDSICIRRYAGVSYSLVGTKRPPSAQGAGPDLGD